MVHFLITSAHLALLYNDKSNGKSLWELVNNLVHTIFLGEAVMAKNSFGITFPTESDTELKAPAFMSTVLLKHFLPEEFLECVTSI